ncbi:hypothetical protein LTR22_022621 [Elasticomyces elasticus]|nr:hypothetical protein LTR22_022621 [Elasticomyces elasticus]KAK4911686.1 hypothetical protein LTR49_019765 [Elasticomyces elasticus]KAK5751316.1 hypothetical protein LTS12_018632 [Elasticomyces elasticus]
MKTTPNVFRSVHPDLELPHIDLVTDVFSNPYHVPASTIILIDPVSQRNYTFATVIQRVKSLAHGLRELGVKEGDVVGLFSPNTIDYAIICFAVVGCGAVFSPISAALTAQELRDQLETAQAAYLVADSALMPIARTAGEGLKHIRHIVQADGQTSIAGVKTADMMASNCPATSLYTISPSEAITRPALLCFSSGTTGKAKGTLISHFNVTSNMRQMNTHRQRNYSAVGQTQIAFLPMSHIYGLHNYLCCSLQQGATVVVLRQFSLEGFLGAVERYRPVDLEVVPPVALLLAKNPKVEEYDLSSVRFIMSAAAPLSRELALAVEARFEGQWGREVRCWQAFGLSECSPAVTTLPLSASGSERRFTVGSILPNLRMRVVDPETEVDVGVGVGEGGWTEAGEIWIAGPNVFLGYLRNAEASQGAFSVEADGTRWYRTGDVGRVSVDGEGYLEILDRLKEMIKFKGSQVIPSELEAKLLQHPYIMDCAVLGKWVEEQATELPVAFVVLIPEAMSEGPGTAVEEIHVWFNAQVASYKRLRGGIRVVDVIPKSPSGKILRRQLKFVLKEEAVRLAKL